MAASRQRRGILDHLSRRTDGRSFIPVVDGLRFLAIAMVVLNHVGNNSRMPLPLHPRLLQVFQEGHFGVEIFFAISGFILALPFARHALVGGKPVDLKRYFVRRVTRLEPPYLISLTLIFLG